MVDISISKSVLRQLAPYITIEGGSGQGTYDYKTRKMFSLPIVKHTMHRDKHNKNSIIYMAVSASASVDELESKDLLYVGSQSGPDRMFRGDNKKGTNFHQAEMRKGENGKNLIQYLSEEGDVVIYASSGERVKDSISENPLFARYDLYYNAIEESQKDKKMKKSGNGFAIEQIVLLKEKEYWAWNTKGAEGHAISASRHLSNISG